MLDLAHSDIIRPGLLDTIRPPAWMRDAACVEHPELPWFPERGEDPARIEAAKRVCAACLVRVECAGYAREHAIKDGIWAGTTPDDRAGRTERRQATIAASLLTCPTCTRQVRRLHDDQCWTCHCVRSSRG